MKFIYLLFICIFVSRPTLHSQTFAEWFKQEKTQIQYLQTQITALGVYAKILENGYEIAKNGLYTIGRIGGEDFDLHSNYLTSLKAVNPRLKSYWKIAETIALEEEILKNTSKHKLYFKNSSFYKSDELFYIENVYNQLLTRCQNSIEELICLTTNGVLDLKDNERLDRIDQIYTNVLDRYVFERYFSSQAFQLSLNRARELSEINDLKTINEIN